MRAKALRGRGTAQQPKPRYHAEARERFESENFRTTVQEERSRKILTRIQSPDVPLEQSLNPYRGCEHGCIYCYARPSHAWLDLSPGIDFESRLFARSNAAECLRQELSRPGYRCAPIALGSNTDPYQPIERRWRITRSILEVLLEFRHPCTIVTKSWLVERDIDLLQELARRRLVQVFLSVTTLDHGLARILEPRATAPLRRVETLERLRQAGIKTGAMFAPVIPAINEHEMEAVLSRCHQAGIAQAGYVLLRLPLEVEPLFIDWLETHMPERKAHVLSLLRQCHEGELYSARFHQRMRGSGPYAEIIRQRFHRLQRRLGLNRQREALDRTQFRVPPVKGGQRPLF